MRSVFARIVFRSIGFGMSVWQHATEYLICSIKNSWLSADYADYPDSKIMDAWINAALIFSPSAQSAQSVYLRLNHRTRNAPIDGTGEVTIRVLYFSIYFRRSSASG